MYVCGIVVGLNFILILQIQHMLQQYNIFQDLTVSCSLWHCGWIEYKNLKLFFVTHTITRNSFLIFFPFYSLPFSRIKIQSYLHTVTYQEAWLIHRQRSCHTPALGLELWGASHSWHQLYSFSLGSLFHCGFAACTALWIYTKMLHKKLDILSLVSFSPIIKP